MAKKILVVDDETELVNFLQIRLEHGGYEVITAYDGENGLKKAKAEIPDLIILDIMMPGMDGYEVCRKIKIDPNTKDIPIIMLTARAQGVDELKGFESGTDVYVPKPYEFPLLVKEIKRLLKEEAND